MLIIEKIFGVFLIKVFLQMAAMAAMSTQGGSVRTYKWVVLFMWQLNEEHPFSVVPLHHFKKSQKFPFELITGPLTDKSRLVRYKLDNVPGNGHSIFCKIEEGPF